MKRNEKENTERRQTSAGRGTERKSSQRSAAQNTRAERVPAETRTEQLPAADRPRRRLREVSERADGQAGSVTVHIKTPVPPSRPTAEKSDGRELHVHEREKRRWVADTVRDILIAVLGGVISFTVSVLLLAL